MVTRFKSKQDAESFCRELDEHYGVGVYHKIYKGHREYCVQHNDMSAEEVTLSNLVGFDVNNDKARPI